MPLTRGLPAYLLCINIIYRITVGWVLGSWLANLSQGWQGKNCQQFSSCTPACSSEWADGCCLSAWGWNLYLLISQIHWGWMGPLISSSPSPPAQAGSLRADCPGHVPLGFEWTSRVETPQLLWAPGCSAWPQLQSHRESSLGRAHRLASAALSRGEGSLPLSCWQNSS